MKWINLLLFPQHLMCIGMIPVLQDQLVSIPRQVDYIMGPWLNWSFVPYAYAMLSCAYFQTTFKQLTFCKTEMTGSAWFLFFLFSYIWLQLRALILYLSFRCTERIEWGAVISCHWPLPTMLRRKAYHFYFCLAARLYYQTFKRTTLAKAQCWPGYFNFCFVFLRLVKIVFCPCSKL